MEVTRKYFQDKLILLLVSSNVFLAFLCVALIFLRLGQGAGEGYILEYRSNLGISAFTRGSIIGILSFVGFVLTTVTLNIMLSMRIYTVRRDLSSLVLGMGILLLAITIIVSNTLLVLR